MWFTYTLLSLHMWFTHTLLSWHMWFTHTLQSRQMWFTHKAVTADVVYSFIAVMAYVVYCMIHCSHGICGLLMHCCHGICGLLINCCHLNIPFMHRLLASKSRPWPILHIRTLTRYFRNTKKIRLLLRNSPINKDLESSKGIWTARNTISQNQYIRILYNV